MLNLPKYIIIPKHLKSILMSAGMNEITNVSIGHMIGILKV